MSGERMVRICRHCMREAMVIRTQVIGERMSCVLDCGHTCIYPTVRWEEEPMAHRGNTGRSVTCLCCTHTYITWFTDDDYWTKFCGDCRAALNIRNQAEGEQVIDLIESFPAEARPKAREIVNLVREKGICGAAVHTALAKSPTHQTHQVTGPRADPIKVAEAVRAMTGYGRIAGTTPEEGKGTEYVIHKGGLMEVRHSDIADIILVPKAVQGVLVELTPGVHLKLPKVPFRILTQTVAFFREVCEKAKGTSEAFLSIWWNAEDLSYHIHVPEQRVSGGSVNHTGAFDREGERLPDGTAKWIYVMDIHSHGTSMGAFWSGTDDGDERKAPEGRMFGVIGRVGQSIPEWRWRMRAREGFIDLSLADVWAVDLTAEVPFTVSWDVILAQLSSKDGLKDGKVNLSCPVDPFKDASCPPEWHAKVDARGFVGGVGGGGGAGGRGGFGGGGGRHYSHHGSVTNPTLIYVTSDGGRSLDEYEVIGGSSRKTGVTIPIMSEKEAGDGHTH